MPCNYGFEQPLRRVSWAHVGRCRSSHVCFITIPKRVQNLASQRYVADRMTLTGSSIFHHLHLPHQFVSHMTFVPQMPRLQHPLLYSEHAHIPKDQREQLACCCLGGCKGPLEGRKPVDGQILSVIKAAAAAPGREGLGMLAQLHLLNIWEQRARG